MTTSILGRTIAVLFLIGTVACFVYAIGYAFHKKWKKAALTLIIAVCLGTVFICIASKQFCEPRKAGNSSITVYNSEGFIDHRYSGKLNIIDEGKGWVYFEDEEGKEHTICTLSGTIIIEQKFEPVQLPGKNYAKKITVLDSYGKIIRQYEGYQEIKKNEKGYISFENTEGKVRTIYYSGTIILDEE